MLLMFIRHLLNNLTTLFAWTPATLLIVVAIIGALSAWGQTPTLPPAGILTYLLIATGGIAGYIALTAICWNLKLPARLVLALLAAGILAMAALLALGALTANPFIHLRTNWVDWYLYVGPLAFGLAQLAIRLLDQRRR
ncbi:MAG: hypothetical protein Tsb002_36150 [Wenzhouxiangellaceae bacterium]